MCFGLRNGADGTCPWLSRRLQICFMAKTVQEAMKKIEELYARVAFHGDEVNAKEDLRIFLQKDVRYER